MKGKKEPLYKLWAPARLCFFFSQPNFGAHELEFWNAVGQFDRKPDRPALAHGIFLVRDCPRTYTFPYQLLILHGHRHGMAWHGWVWLCSSVGKQFISTEPLHACT
ncbi:hypothetical protein TWF173_011543 [Orbilia oligospora]|nr:hypothetical protein TWF173_011543 [Orbilia oligospora]